MLDTTSGRITDLFEGTPQQMWTSLSKLATLPKETRVYCGHEYTASNVKFALTVDGDNPALKARAEEVARLRAQNKATIPVKLGEEKKSNGAHVSSPCCSRSVRGRFASLSKCGPRPGSI